MKRVQLAVVAALLAISFAFAQTPFESTAQTSIRYAVMPVSGSGVHGSVFIAEYPNLDGAVISTFLVGTPAGAVHPSHFHTGDCGSNGDIVVPLSNVDGDTGLSVTVTDAPYDTIINENLYLNIHLSPDDMGTIVACGEVGQGAEAMTGVMSMDTGDMDMQSDDAATDAALEPLPPEAFETLSTAAFEIYSTENSDVNGTVQVTENQTGGARVTITLQNVPSGQYSFPVHFHSGDCGSGGSIVIPLQTVPAQGLKDSSVTEVEASFDEIINQDLYINFHASPDNMGTTVACGEVGQGANDQWR